VPVLLLDGTGLRAGEAKTCKNGVELHPAVEVVARRRQGDRVVLEDRLLGATLGEGWKAMGKLLAGGASRAGHFRRRGSSGAWRSPLRHTRR